MVKKNIGVENALKNTKGKRPSDITEHEFRELQPLTRRMESALEYPVDSLGLVLGNAAKAMQSAIQAPMASCAQSTLAAATHAVQGHVDVVICGRKLPVSLFFLTIGVSGDRKTAVDTVAQRAHREYERSQHVEYEATRRNYQVECALFEKAEKAILSGKDDAEKKRLLKELKVPKPPRSPVMSVEEPTYEGLVKHLRDGHPSVSIATDEGGRFIGGHGMNSDNQLKMAAGLSNGWDGKPISVSRAGEGTSKIYGKRITVNLMAQPEVANLLIGNDLLNAQGLVARFLVCWPEGLAGTREFQQVDLSQDESMKAYDARMTELLKMKLPVHEDSQDALNPRELGLSGDAMESWIGFHNSVEAALAPGGQYTPITAFGSKAAEHCLRLAAVLTVVENIKAASIELDAILNAQDLMDFYLKEALRIRNGAAAAPIEIAQAQILVEWLRRRQQKKRMASDPEPDKISLVEIYTYGPPKIRDAHTASELMRILSDHGYVRPCKEFSVKLAGIPRKYCYEIRSLEDQDKLLISAA